MATKTKAVAEYVALTDDELDLITDAASAFATMTNVYGETESVNKFGLIRNKDALIGKPFAVLRFDTVTDPDTSREYFNIKCITPDGKFFAFNDGSTGVYAQLASFMERTGKRGGIRADNGLRKSMYTTEVDGKPEKATTYYLD